MQLAHHTAPFRVHTHWNPKPSTGGTDSQGPSQNMTLPCVWNCLSVPHRNMPNPGVPLARTKHPFTLGQVKPLPFLCLRQP